MPIVIESFEESTLIDFWFKFKSDLPLVMLMHDWMDYDLEWISTFAHGIGPKWNVIFNKTDPYDL